MSNAFSTSDNKQTNLIIATRGSSLALWQAEHVRGLLVNAFADLCIDFSIIKTTGDQLQSNPPSNISKGLFTKEIEIALLDQKIDLAVHSVKDLPTDLPKGLKICCIPAREDPRDALISKSGLGLNNLPTGAKIGTSSLRRKSQLFYLRSDLEVTALRGNIDTRMRKLKETDLDESKEINPKYFGAGWMKVYLEKTCDFYSRFRQTKHTVFRQTNIYGPHDKYDLQKGHVFGSTIVKVNLRKKQKLYINDGTYGTLFDAGVPNIVYPSRLITNRKIISKKLTSFDFYGPTCDSMDYMKGPFILPNNIKENDYIELGQLGAYGLTFRTDFNGFYSDEIYEVEDDPIMTMYNKEANKEFLVA